jgi:hypothetical protein
MNLSLAESVVCKLLAIFIIILFVSETKHASGQKRRLQCVENLCTSQQEYVMYTHTHKVYGGGVP